MINFNTMLGRYFLILIIPVVISALNLSIAGGDDVGKTKKGADIPFSINAFDGNGEKLGNGKSYELEVLTDSGESKPILNLSGIAYIPQMSLYYGITNGNADSDPKVYVLDDKFKIVHEVKMVGFENKVTPGNQNPGMQNDFEGITFIEMGKKAPILALVNEIGELYIGEIEDDEKKITPDELTRVVFNNGNDEARKLVNNKGPEGITYDAETRTVYVAIEGDHTKDSKDFPTMRIESFVLPEKFKDGLDLSERVVVENAMTKTLLGNEKIGRPALDLSAIHFDRQTRTLFVVSDDSNMVHQLAINGELLATITLGSKLQMEGVTSKDSGELVVASEQNIVVNLGLIVRDGE